MFLFVFFIFSVSFCGFWEAITNYDLTSGFNETCSEQKIAYKSEFTGTSNELNFQIENTQGFQQIFYTFNLYYTHPQILQFSENYIQFYEQFLEEQSQDYFPFCNSFYSVKYVRLFTNNLLDQNFIQFLITADTPHQFIITNLKIYFKRCNTNCKKCSINGYCEQCMNNFQLNQNYKCQCYYQKPFIFINECVEQCPLGYFPYYQTCIIHSFQKLLLIDEYAEKHILIPDFNTTNRLTKIFIDGKIQAGPFIQNEAISYYLDEQINTSTNLYLQFELYLFNSENLFYLSVYLDEVMFQEIFLNELIKNQRGLENILEECTIPDYSKCLKVKYGLNIEKLEQLKYIKFQWNLPLQNPNIFWTLSFIKLYEVKQQFNDSINQNQNNECPITTKLVGSKCVSITKQYTFSAITFKNYTSFLEDVNNPIFIQPQQYYDFNFYQQYQDRYIFGGYRKWKSEQYIFDINISQPHYKVKIYFKILLIDPLQLSDQFLIQILDKQFTFSKDSPQSQCFSIANTINCVESENIGQNSNDYVIQFEEEFEHNISTISIFMQCVTNSNNFYCGFYDLIILVANCPLNCEKCLNSNSCEQTFGKYAGEILEVKYVCDEGYYNLDGICYQCGNFCKICDNSLICITCKDGYDKIGNQCICSYNHINALFTDCQQQCHQSCSVCQKQQLYIYANNKFCAKCSFLEKKVLNVNKCVCIDGYHMNEQTISFKCEQCDQTCKTCKNSFLCESCHLEQNRVLDDFKCVCKPGYYEQIAQNQTCLKCSSQCKTCQYSSNNCSSCFLSQNRTLNSNNICQCQLGYYEDENKNCQKCNFKCESCENIDNCLSCNQDQYRKLIKQQCQCQEGYYEDKNNFECQKCHYTCSKCNYNNLYNQCTLCPITRTKTSQNLLNTFQCLCKKGYYENYELNCLSCQNYINPPQNHYCYSKCGDLIIQWNEDCDDDNQIQRDDCYQCKFSNSSCNNLNCLKCQQNECIQCKDGYYLNDQNQCQQCSNNCLTCKFNENNCIQCKYLIQNTNKCLLCNEDQGYKIINEQCYPICGDGIKTLNEQCDDGNSINNDGCDQYCQIEQNYICNFNCEKINFIQILLKEIDKTSIYESKRIIELTFDQKVKLQSESQIKDLIIIEPFQNDLKIQNLEILDFTDYSNKLTTVLVQIQFDIEDSFIEPKIKVQIQQNNLFENENGYSFQQSTSFITLMNYNKPSQKMIELTQSSVILNNYILYFLLFLAIIAFIFGGLDIFWNLLDTLQLISYFKYFNINYPYNLQQYFLIFSFAQFDFIKKQFDLQSVIAEKVDAPQAPEKFSNEGYSTLFLINMVSIAIIFLLQFIIYLAFKILIYLENILFNYLIKSFNYKKTIIFSYFFIFSIKFKRKLQIHISYFNNIILRTYFASVFELNIIIFLQLKYFLLTTSFLLLNIMSAFFILMIQFIIINFGINLMSQNKPFFQQFIIKLKYGTFFEGINLNRGRVNYYFHIIGLIKKIIFAASLVWFYDYAGFQIGIALLLSLFLFSFLILQRSLRDKNELNKQIFCELILTIVQMTIFIFGLNSEKNQTLIINTIQDDLGIVIIILLSLLLCVQLVFDCKQQIQYLMQKYSKDIYQLYHLLKIWKNFNLEKLFFKTENGDTQKNVVARQQNKIQQRILVLK